MGFDALDLDVLRARRTTKWSRLTAALRDATTLPAALAAGVGGYGIDVFLLLTAATVGPVSSVWVEEPKQHAGSFPHLPAIYHQAVPVLLHLSTTWTPARPTGAQLLTGPPTASLHLPVLRPC